MTVRKWWLGPTLLGLVLAIQTLTDRFPPMADGATHLQLISILVHRNEPAFLPELLQNNWGHPNQLLYALGWPLGVVLGVLPAFKLMVALSEFMLVLGAARLLRLQRRSLWAVCLVPPLAAGFYYIWGLATYLLGMAVLVWAVPSIDRYARRPSLRGAAVVALWTLATYFAHESMAFVLIGAQGLFAMIYWRGLRTFFAQTFAVPLLLALHQWETFANQEQTAITSQTIWDPFVARITSFRNMYWGPQFDAPTRWVQDVLTLLLLLSLLASLVALPARWRRHRWQRWAIHFRYLLLGLSCLALFLTMPTIVHAATMIHIRFASMFFLFVVVGLTPAEGHAGFGRKALWAVVPPTLFVSSLSSHMAAAEQLGDLEPLIELISPGSNIAVIHADANDKTVLQEAYFDGCAFATAMKGGRSSVSFVESAIAPVIVRKGYEWSHTFDRIRLHGGGFRPGYDFTYFRYALVQTENLHKSQVIAKLLPPEGRFLAHSGAWTLFESTLPLKPVLSSALVDDASLPSLSDRAACVGYLSNAQAWIRSELSIANLVECQPAQRPANRLPGELPPTQPSLTPLLRQLPWPQAGGRGATQESNPGPSSTDP